MKIRTSFVSNSSSSSFIVLFPHVPKDVDDVHEMMFGEEEQTIQPYDVPLSSKFVATQVYHDTRRQPEDLNEELQQLFQSLSRNKKDAKTWLKKQTGDSKIYVFEWGDENGLAEGIMEHGNIFEGLPHVRISRH